MSLTKRERGTYTRGGLKFGWAYIQVEKRVTNLGALYSGELIHWVGLFTEFYCSHLKFGKTKKAKIKNYHFHNPLIVNQSFSKTELIIGKSDLTHIIHFQ